ncbi:NADH:ubiquinone oxidoreductase 24 kD subunit [Shewanella psychrophila]|uniref:NADH-quinone oxidoreductase subunit E n=1 Tax=Shewanella psychrophila TaxID=225848 RepID=A0A1S6HT12_9GAMM|nr:NADH-quinone oxidoreductase subunit NuoE [Shewanella psychrophila]AQS38676.1 NADH:ubiquinone oxidoreductase 24 kD subunit [Shewanella psychrophila]
MTQSYEQLLRISIQEVMSGDLPSNGDASADDQTSSRTQPTSATPEKPAVPDDFPSNISQSNSAPVATSSETLTKVRDKQVDEYSSQLSPCETQQLDKLLVSAPYPAAVSIDALKVIQARRGWVSDASLSLLSAYIKVTIAELDSVATFYNLIFRQAVGEIVLHPCDGISCDLMGGIEVRAAISQRLHINPGETTPDNHFTLIPLPCLGACDKAPVMIAAKRVHQHLTVSKIAKLIDGLEENSK